MTALGGTKVEKAMMDVDVSIRTAITAQGELLEGVGTLDISRISSEPETEPELAPHGPGCFSSALLCRPDAVSSMLLYRLRPPSISSNFNTETEIINEARDDTGGVPAEEREKHTERGKHTERAGPLRGTNGDERQRTVRTANGIDGTPERYEYHRRHRGRHGNPARYTYWAEAISIVDTKAETVTGPIATTRLGTEEQRRANREEKMYYLYLQLKIAQEKTELVKLKSIKRYESRLTERRSGVFNRQTVLQQARNRVVV